MLCEKPVYIFNTFIYSFFEKQLRGVMVHVPRNQFFILFSIFLFLLLVSAISAQPNIVLTKVDVPDPVHNGSNIVYTITLNNTGDAAAFNVTISETFDGNTTFVSASPAANDSPTNVTWFFESLNALNHSTINITRKVNSTTANATPVNNTLVARYNTSGAGGASTPYVANGSIITTVSQAPVVVLSKVDSPDPVQNGSEVVYTIVLNNTGGTTAWNISVVEVFDGNTTFVSASPAANDSPTNTSWFVERIFPGNHTTINITRKVNSSTSNGTTLNNTVRVTYNETQVSSYWSANTSILTSVVSPPHLEFYKVDSPDPVRNGSNIDYVIVINNTGGMTAVNVTLVEVLYDGNTTHVSLSPAANDSPTNTSWFFENLYPGNHTTVNITRRVNSSVVNGTPVNNTVFVTYNSTTFQSYFRSNSSIVTSVSHEPVLVVTKSDDPDPVRNGSNIVYTFVFNNTGFVTVYNVTLFETFDGNTTFVSASPAANDSPTNTTWFIERIFAGNHSTINITRKVNSTTINGTTVNNTAFATFNDSIVSTYLRGNVSILTTVVVPPVLVVTKSDSPDPVRNGSTIDYVIVINNTGGTTAKNVTLVETYDGNTTGVTVVSPAANVTNTTWFFENLFPGNHTTVNVTVRVNSSTANSTTINNTVRVSYNESLVSSYWFSNNSILTTVVVPPVLVITKDDNELYPIILGSSITYTIMVNNTGGPAQDVIINDTWNNAEYVPGSANLTPFSNTTHNLVWHVNLSANQQLQINFSLNPLLTGTVNNNASVQFYNTTVYRLLNATVGTTVDIGVPLSTPGGGSGGAAGGSAGSSYAGAYTSPAVATPSTRSSSSPASGTSTTKSVKTQKSNLTGKQTEPTPREETTRNEPPETREEETPSEPEEPSEEKEQVPENKVWTYLGFLILLIVIGGLLYVAYRQYPKTPKSKTDTSTWAKKK